MGYYPRVRGGCFSIWLFAGLIGLPLLTLITLFGGGSGIDMGVTVIFNMIAFFCYLAIWNWNTAGVYGLYGLTVVRVLLDLIVMARVPYADSLWSDIVLAVISTIVMAVVTRPLFEVSPDYTRLPPPEPLPQTLPPGCPPNCPETNLAGRDLRGDNFSQANLHRANLSRANLEWADLQGAKLQGADLQRANLQGAKLAKADLQAANLMGANLREASLQEANLKGANLMSANLREASLQAANLMDANIREASLQGSNLSEADLLQARLYKAKYNQETIWPANFDPNQARAIRED